MLSPCCRNAAFPSKICKPAGPWALLWLVLLLPLAAGAQEQGCPPAAPPGLTETLSGLKLHESTVCDIQSRLGPALIFQDHAAAGSRRMCYVSTLDYTLISFTTKGNVITRLQVLSDKHRFSHWDWCAPTPMSADDLTLANGITLGARPEDVVKALGNAHGGNRENWHYSFGLKPQQQQAKTGCPPNQFPSRAAFELVFENARLTSFAVNGIDSNRENPPICP